ncbi:MAG TPA: response regulator [Solirubrobacteraceae bacterium]
MSAFDPEAPVLVVDDNPEVRESLVALLESDGYRVLVASSGMEALALMRRAEPPPGVVLLDLMMPGMDGWDFRAAQLSDARLAAIPVIVTSAHPLARHAANTGVAAVLQKPVDPQALLTAVARHRARG